MHLVLRQLKLSGAHILVREEFNLLETYDLRPHEHVAMRACRWPSDGLFFSHFEDANLGVADRIREVVRVDRLYIGFALVEIQTLDVVLLPLMDVDRFWMDGGKCGREVNLADHLRLAFIFSRRVDDDEIVAETYALTLENAGMQCSVKTDSAAALDEITATYPDLVLMDMQMPRVSGIELARMIRQSRRHLSLPIVFLSAERDPARQLEARMLGGDDFISKPVAPDRLVSLVRMRAERANRLRSIMDRDSLTGLLNHGRFIDRLHQELERCRRAGTEVSLALIDLDRFKNVNDAHGHLSGDQVLRTLAHSLSSGLRRIDVIGRYGGEEFGVILLDSPPEAAVVAIDKIRQRFSEITFDAKENVFSATFSAGVSGSRSHPTPEQLIAAADEQMYLAKMAGRNRTLGERLG